MEEQFLDTVHIDHIVDHEAGKRCHGCINVPKLKLKGNPEGTRDARQWSFFGSEIVQIGWSVILNQYHLGLNIPQIYGTARILTHTLQSPELLGLSFGPWDKLRYLQKGWIRRHMVMVVGNILGDLGFFHFENEWWKNSISYIFSVAQPGTRYLQDNSWGSKLVSFHTNIFFMGRLDIRRYQLATQKIPIATRSLGGKLITHTWCGFLSGMKTEIVPQRQCKGSAFWQLGLWNRRIASSFFETRHAGCVKSSFEVPDERGSQDAMFKILWS